MLVIEGMALGKPVISTAWSGTMDFTTAANSCLVPFRAGAGRGAARSSTARSSWAVGSGGPSRTWMRRRAGCAAWRTIRTLRAQIGWRRAREVRRRQKHNAAADFPERLRARYAELVARPDAGRGWRQRHAEAMLSGAHGAYEGARRAYRFARSVKDLA